MPSCTFLKVKIIKSNQANKSRLEQVKKNGEKYSKATKNMTLSNLMPCKSCNKNSYYPTFRCINGLIMQTSYDSYKPTNGKIPQHARLLPNTVDTEAHSFPSSKPTKFRLCS